MPEVIEMKKVLIKVERTSCLKPDLHVTINADALEGDGKSKPEGGGSKHSRKSFHKRLADLSKSHPEDYEIPEETLSQPFGPMKQDMRPDTDKLPLSSSQGDEISDMVKLPFVIISDQVSVVVPLLKLKKATKSLRDGSNISSYLFHRNQLFPLPQSGMVSTVKALCFQEFGSLAEQIGYLTF